MYNRFLCVFEDSEVGVAARVESREHAADVGKEGRVFLAVEQEAGGDGDGASEQAEKG